jgi:hypothetical protein
MAGTKETSCISWEINNQNVGKVTKSTWHPPAMSLLVKQTARQHFGALLGRMLGLEMGEVGIESVGGALVCEAVRWESDAESE